MHFLEREIVADGPDRSANVSTMAVITTGGLLCVLITKCEVHYLNRWCIFLIAFGRDLRFFFHRNVLKLLRVKSRRGLSILPRPLDNC